MLIHLVPSIHAAKAQNLIALVDISSPELGLHLTAGKEIVARKPFPNKGYLVACRNEGQKAMTGILLETSSLVSVFSVITRWAVAAEKVVTHRVHYSLLDTEHELVSEYMTLWSRMCQGLGGWESRWPAGIPNGTPMELQPQMEVFPGTPRKGRYTDTMTSTGFIQEREEWFKLPTLELGRLSSSIHDRLPSRTHSFQVGV